jgi:hypothetical protein
LRVAGCQKGLAVVAVRRCQKKRGLVHLFIIVEIRKSDGFRSLKSCGGGWMVVRRTHQEQQVERTFGIHTGHDTAGNVRSSVANHVTEFENFKLLYL